MDKMIGALIKNWQKRNIEGLYCENKDKAAAKLLEIVPKAASIGMSGSVTLDELGVVKGLEARGNKIFNQYRAGLSRGESLELRKQGILADYYLASANAVSETGELIFFSAYGNRTAGISYAKNVVIVCGINKIAKNLSEALKRAREYATPLNCKRLNWNTPCFKDGICRQDICLFPEYKRMSSSAEGLSPSALEDYPTKPNAEAVRRRRMCCQVLIIEAEVTPDRLKVILVGENLGF